MPVDPEPSEDGNVAVYRDDTGRLRSRVISKNRPLATHETLMMPHFATCASRR